MIILHIGIISGNKHAGPTTNVPKNVIYENKYETVALLNCFPSVDLSEFIDKKYVYNITDYKKISDLPSPFNKPDIAVFQGMYCKDFLHLGKELRKSNIPYVVVPRGSLTKNAQKKKKYKKIIGNFLGFNSFIKNAASINFLTENEYVESKKCFKFKDYYINGNGIELKDKHRDFSKNNDNLMITFIGRVEWYHKGLDYLTEAINLGQAEMRKKKFMFNLYGPDDSNSYDKLNKMINDYSIDDLVIIHGPVYG